MGSFHECGSFTVWDADARVENWQRGFNKLEANDYTTEIPKDILDIRGKIITQMDFANTTLFKNVLLILSNCANLRKVGFHDILLEIESNSLDDGYHRVNNHNDSITLPKLSSITFGGKGRLSSSEMFLLEFLTVEVSMPELESLSFTEETCSRSARSRTSTPSESDDPKDDILIKFLIKNASALKKLRIKRTPFSLIAGATTTVEPPKPNPPDVANSNSARPPNDRDELVSKLKSLQLNHLITYSNCRGVESLVAHQENLELLFLDCSNPYSFHGVQVQEYMEAIQNCVTQCAASLAIVIAPGVIPTGGAEGEELINHDLSIYKDCTSLMYLTLDKVYVGEGEHLGGTFVNGGQLPISLMQLSLLVHHVQEEELTKLLENLPNLTYLRDFELKSLTPFTITSEGFQIILKVSRAVQKTFKFFNGFLHSSIVPQNFLNPPDDPTVLPQWSVTINQKGTLFCC